MELIVYLAIKSWGLKEMKDTKFNPYTSNKKQFIARKHKIIEKKLRLMGIKTLEQATEQQLESIIITKTELLNHYKLNYKSWKKDLERPIVVKEYDEKIRYIEIQINKYKEWVINQMLKTKEGINKIFELEFANDYKDATVEHLNNIQINILSTNDPSLENVPVKEIKHND